MSASRQLELAKRENFFSDPLFKDIWSFDDTDLQKRLETFKNKSALALKSQAADTAHNLQVSCSNDKFMIQLELPGFLPEDFGLKTKDDVILLEANHEGKGDGATSRKFVKEFKIPEGVVKDQLQSTYSSEGILTINAPRKINAPEGAEVQEAMAAASKAYTTDDGKTSVKQDSSSASQLIATSTKSDDGSFSSSTSFSSSSMSSSSSTTTSTSGPGGPKMSLEMDDMMKKMMEGMSMGGGSSMMTMGGPGGDLSSMMSSGSKMMSSSSKSFSSSSSTMMSSSSSSMSKMMGGMGGMPSLLDKMGPGVDFEELSTAGTDITGPPAYTVTSPRPSVDNTASGMKFTVQPTPDFKPKQEADCSVLLKLKKGDEYKLVLNMQAYNPENITVKLNGQELTILASANPGSTDDFKQTHVVPEGIDLDQMTSSFSSDGVLVVKAPKKK
jgi:HSP20 family molecular chaperone IbpA